MNIAQNTIAAIDYVLTSGDGEELDSSAGQEPLVYLHGAGHLIPGLEAQLAGKAVGDTFQAVIPPAEAYGERDDQMVQDVPRGDFPDGMELEIGMTLQAQSPAGVQVVTVVGLEDDKVTLDGNHPLAGVTLHFDVTVRDVRAATAEEIAQAQEHHHSHHHGEGSCGGGGGSCGCGH